jgi:predicted nucleic-acid-binding Zn-ribbon protein
MRTSLRCPKCACVRLWEIDAMLLPDCDNRNYQHRLPVLTRGGDGGQDRRIARGARREAGHFTAWICSSCGYTEWYAEDVNEVLHEFVRYDGSGVRLHDGG